MIKTFEQLQTEIAKLMPNADIQTDLQGQLIIYTGLTTPRLMDQDHSDNDNTLIEFEQMTSIDKLIADLNEQCDNSGIFANDDPEETVLGDYYYQVGSAVISRLFTMLGDHKKLLESFNKNEDKLEAIHDMISAFGFTDPEEANHQLTMHSKTVPETLHRAYMVLDKIKDQFVLTDEEMEKLGL